MPSKSQFLWMCEVMEKARFYEDTIAAALAGSAERCSTFAVGALRQDLPVDTTFDAPLMTDFRNRIEKAARAKRPGTNFSGPTSPSSRSRSQSN